MYKDNIGLRGLIKIKHERDGKIIDQREIKNTITNTGLAEIANLAGNVSTPVAFTYLALGIGTTAADATDTALESEIIDTGLARASATVTRQTTTATNDTLQLVHQYTATGVKAVTECGGLNDASVGIMLGRQVFSALNTAANDTITITYQFIFV